MLEAKVFDYIQTFTAKNGFAPAIRDICKGCDVKSTATVYYVINSLCDKGLLRKPGKNMRRAVGLVSASVVAPSLGNKDNGNGIFAIDNYEDFYALPSNYFFGDDIYIFTAADDSMKASGIQCGDKVIMRRETDTNCEDGDIVIALIEGVALIRHIYFPDEHCTLKADDESLSDDTMYGLDIILGKVIGVMRNFE